MIVKNVLKVWPRKSHGTPIKMVVGGDGDIVWLADLLGFSLSSLETDHVAATDSHFISYGGIDPYTTWKLLMEKEQHE